MLLSLRDQHEMERRAWAEAHPGHVAGDALFGAVLAALTVWRRELDDGGDGGAAQDFYRRVFSAFGKCVELDLEVN